ncbi:hypothetical protein MA16_Dca004818 [Dendrobium catenatum]|uniref:Uncharacterized protein n=1 Tax=Dendrobium catenatum TaxID=906689 RepID=A0A2I0WG54_9ASPA|nr:hypothetical protein MA16_Dca004818 [Dendrobium catenatum]
MWERLLRAESGHREPFNFVTLNSKSVVIVHRCAFTIHSHKTERFSVSGLHT